MAKLTPIYTSPEELSAKVDTSMLEGIKRQFPIENRDFRLELTGIRIDKKSFDHRDEKDAILRSKSLTYPIKGDLSLIDKASGKVVDKIKNFSLADSFAITGKHTMLYKGNNYSVANLVQLNPGVYTRQKDTGYLESHFNTSSGRSFSIVLEPESQQFFIEIGSSKTPLAPVLDRVFDVKDSTISKYVPSQVWKANLAKASGKEEKIINNLYSRLVSTRLQSKNATMEDKISALKESLESSKLSSKTTAITLGKPISNVSYEAILLSLRNLVQVHTGERDEDNRDSLQFKKVQNLSDFINRRFSSERSHETVSKAVGKITFKLEKVNKSNPKISQALPTKPFNKVMTDFILGSTLSSTPSETNPIESLENVGKLTIIGANEGGIGSERGVPLGARNIDASHLGIIDPSRTPESSSAGIDQRFTVSARRDDEGNMYARVKDKKGKVTYLSPVEMMRSVIGFPGQEKKKGMVQAQVKGVLTEVKKSKVDYWLSDATDMYTITSNMIPFLNSNHPGRLTMAGKAIPQALSLEKREKPMVQTLDRDGVAFVDKVGKIVSTLAPVSGTVHKVSEDEIQIKDSKGKVHKESLVKNLPFNMKGFLDDEAPKFKAGDKIKAGDVISDNNYTKDGTLALGKNLYATYLPFKGFNHEDGLVIRKGAAEDLKSLHSYKFDYSMKADSVAALATFKRFFPNELTSTQMAKLDKKGIIKKGAKLMHGDPVYAVMEKKEPSHEDKVLGRLHKTLVNPYRKVVQYWEHDEAGEVVDVHIGSKDIRILVRSVKPLEIGDKLTGLHGNKGVISKIIDDHEMPTSNTTGEPVDLILNPASVTSRINLGQVMETAASKIADKTGKPFLVKNYSDDSNIEAIKAKLKEHGLEDTDEIIDPKTGKSLGKALSGHQYTLKLYKTTDSNYSARNVAKYDPWMQPTKGGHQGAKSVGYMEMLGLLGSDARHNLKEIGTIKSEENTEFWDKFINGRPLPKPNRTFATNKLFNYLKAVGVNVKTDDGKVSANPITDAEILALSNGELKNAKRLHKDLDPEKGGLYDFNITGGLNGENWSHYKLAEPIVNPLYENPVKSILGLSTKEFNGITEGSLGVNRVGRSRFNIVNTETGELIKTVNYTPKSGLEKSASEEEAIEVSPLVSGSAFREMLDSMDVEKEILKTKDEAVNSTSVSRKNTAVKKLKYLDGLRKSGLEGGDAYVLSNMPVLPPKMRPVINLGGNRLEYSDVNELYKEHFLINNSSKELIGMLPPEFLVNERKGMYAGMKAVMGLGEATSGRSRGRDLKGIIKQVAGTTGPKTGAFHSKILSKKQDFSGRGTIYAAPDVGFNEIKYPVEGLWEMYKFHIIRDLVKMGYGQKDAQKAWEERNMAAQASFNKMTKDVPVIVNRAPTLMRTNIMAMYAVPVEGKTIGLNPLHLPGFAADYDGDAMSTYVPMTPEAISEAKEKMLPMHHLNDARKGFGNAMFAPGHEAVLGAVHLTEPDEGQKTITFKTEKEALEALESGKIKSNTPIIIKEHK